MNVYTYTLYIYIMYMDTYLFICTYAYVCFLFIIAWHFLYGTGTLRLMSCFSDETPPSTVPVTTGVGGTMEERVVPWQFGAMPSSTG